MTTEVFECLVQTSIAEGLEMAGWPAKKMHAQELMKPPLDMKLEKEKENFQTCPPNPSGKQVPIPSDMALRFVRLHHDSRRKTVHGRQTASRMPRKQHTNSRRKVQPRKDK